MIRPGWPCRSLRIYNRGMRDSGRDGLRLRRESSVRQTATRGLPWVRSLSELQYNTKPNRPETKVKTAFASVRIRAGVEGNRLTKQGQV